MNEQMKLPSNPSPFSGVTGSSKSSNSPTKESIEYGEELSRANPGGEQTATTKAEIMKSNRAEERQKEQLAKLAGIESLDWKAVPPPMLAQMLVNMPFKGSGGDPDYYLQPWQAMIFAMRCFELRLSPFSDEVWFNPKNNKVNVTFSGKLKLARKAGLNLGPPHFEKVERKLPKPDWGYKCTMTSPTGTAEYTAWYSEWNVARSPVWKEKPDHMLQLRAAEKCLSFAAGIGASELPDEQDIAALADKPVPSVQESAIEVTEFKYQPQGDERK